MLSSSSFKCVCQHSAACKTAYLEGSLFLYHVLLQTHILLPNRYVLSYHLAAVLDEQAPINLHACALRQLPDGQFVRAQKSHLQIKLLN